jgi:hypothetical protein
MRFSYKQVISFLVSVTFCGPVHGSWRGACIDKNSLRVLTQKKREVVYAQTCGYRRDLLQAIMQYKKLSVF